MPSDLPPLFALAEDITFRLRQDFEKGGGSKHCLILIPAIVGYLAKHPRRPLHPTNDPVCGLASHFVRWLKRHPPRGGGSDGREVRGWIHAYAA